MAVHHLYTIVCDYLVQAKDGRVTAAGIFHNIEVDQFPAAKNHFGFVVAIRGEASDEFEVALEDPDGEKLLSQTGVIEPPTDLREGQQWGLTLAGVAAPAVFRRPGVYRVVLRTGEQELSSYPFGVLQKRIPEEGSDNGPSATDV